MINVPQKYQFTGKTKPLFLEDQFGEPYSIKVHQIQAVRSFGNIVEGDIGGWVARGSRDERGREPNLSHQGNCWIADDAIAFGRAEVKGNAILCGNAVARGHAVLAGNAVVQDHATIRNYALVTDEATVGNWTIIGGVVNVFGRAKLCCRINDGQKYSHVSDLVTLRDDVVIEGNPRIRGHVELGGSVTVRDTVRLSGRVRINGNAIIEHSAKLEDEVFVTGDAHVCCSAKMRGRAIASGRSVVGRGATITDNAHILGTAHVTKEFISGRTYRYK